MRKAHNWLQLAYPLTQRTQERIMATVKESSTIRTDDLAELEKTIENLVQRARDHQAMERAAKEMDEAREQSRSVSGPESWTSRRK
jgi:hypothetical protein